jgi:hypothetical protein
VCFAEACEGPAGRPLSHHSRTARCSGVADRTTGKSKYGASGQVVKTPCHAEEDLKPRRRRRSSLTIRALVEDSSNSMMWDGKTAHVAVDFHAGPGQDPGAHRRDPLKLFKKGRRELQAAA